MSGNQFDIKVEPTRMRSREDGEEYRYTHPSYGMISVSRCGATDKQLFGQDTPVQNYMSLTIESADVEQHLGKNWYFGQKTVVEVEMSQVQYAEMISSPNTAGVPCTIRRSQEHGLIEYKPIQEKTTFVKSKIDRQVDTLRKASVTLSKDVKDILEGKMLKADKERLQELVDTFKGILNSGIPYYVESLEEHIDRKVVEAKADIQASILHEVTKAGFKAIENGDGVLRLGVDEND